MRNRLSANGIHVLTIKPGFVDTPMTADFTKNALWAKPQKIALDIERAISTKKEILYTPFWWRYILMIICAIPERIFKRLSL
jgi:short-subunit dehydrogenase